MTTASAIQGNVNGSVSKSSDSLMDRLFGWLNNVVDGVFGPAFGEACHDNPAEAYLFLNDSCCGAVIDTKLWDLLTDRKAQPETEEATNV
ncbi:MAG: hypothetical protein IH963_01345 [Chloroflexi bacterium]|nr:hypothetical protein [Chloroflexota bacterium]